LRRLAGAQENPKQQDLEVLACASGWDARLLACATVAQRLSADSDVGMSDDVLYALFRVGLPTDKQILAHVPAADAAQALKVACDAGIVTLDNATIARFTPQFTVFADKVRLASAVPGSRSTYAQLLQASGLGARDQATFANVYLNHRGELGELWESLRDAGLEEPQIEKLQVQGKLLFLTGQSQELTTRMLEVLDTDDLSQLAALGFDETRSGAPMSAAATDGATRSPAASGGHFRRDGWWSVGGARRDEAYGGTR